MGCTLYTVCTDSTNPYYNLALEEYLLSQVPGDGVILYLWQNAHTVVIGRNQNPWTECRTVLLEQDSGHLARRLSGGGAVYHDLGNLNFTFLCGEENYDLKKQLSVIQKAVSYCGITAEFSGRNDLLTQGRKFSGNAFYHSKGKAYHHGTLMIDVDKDKLGRYLSPPKAKLEAKGVASVRARVTNLSAFVPGLTVENMARQLVRAAESVYDLPAQSFSFTPEMEAEVARLTAHYASREWRFGANTPASFSCEKTFPWGTVSLELQVERGIISHARVYTDAMAWELSEHLQQALTGRDFSLPAMQEGLLSMEIQPDIRDDLSRMLAEQEI